MLQSMEITRNDWLAGSLSELEGFKTGASSRWTIRRKMVLVDAVNKGRLSEAAALQAFSLTAEEFSSWQGILREGIRTNACGCVLPQGQCQRCASILPLQVKLARAALDWTFEKAARMTGVSLRSLVRFEAGEYLRKDMLEKLQAAFERQGVRFPVSKAEYGILLVRKS